MHRPAKAGWNDAGTDEKENRREVGRVLAEDVVADVDVSGVEFAEAEDGRATRTYSVPKPASWRATILPT